MTFFNFFKPSRFWALGFLSVAAGTIILAYFGQSNFASTQKDIDLTPLNSKKSFSANSETLKFSGSNIKQNNCQNAIPSSMDITFNVSGLEGSVKTVELKDLTFDSNFKWGAGLTATLISPNGTASQTLFGNQNANFKICGATTTLSGPYNFSDAVDNHDSAKLSLAANSKQSNTSSLNSAFNSVTDPNGTWILRLTDNSGSALGTVKNASLSISTNSAAPQITHKNVDFNGDGKSDFVVVRPNGNKSDSSFTDVKNNNFYAQQRFKKMHRPLNANLQSAAADSDALWYSSFNNGNSFTATANGDFSVDVLVPADYDGDGKTDVAVWRPVNPTTATFFIIQSSDNTLRTVNFGNEGDDPSVVADYDGDGKADLATFRCPNSSPGPCYFYYLGTKNNPNNITTTVPWGYGTYNDFYTLTGDFDGDGKADFCLQRENPDYPGLGQFVLLRSSDFGYEFINWGLITDTLVPGDYDGDGKADFGVARIESLPNDPNDKISFYILTRAGGGTGASPIRFGDPFDYVVPGDYDGDGKTDIAVWRGDPTDSSDPTPGQSKFYVYKSSDKGLIVYPWGLDGDTPAAVWQVH